MDADDHRGGWSTTDATPALHCMQNSVALQRHGGRISETCLKKKRIPKWLGIFWIVTHVEHLFPLSIFGVRFLFICFVVLHILVHHVNLFRQCLCTRDKKNWPTFPIAKSDEKTFARRHHLFTADKLWRVGGVLSRNKVMCFNSFHRFVSQMFHIVSWQKILKIGLSFRVSFPLIYDRKLEGGKNSKKDRLTSHDDHDAANVFFCLLAMAVYLENLVKNIRKNVFVFCFSRFSRVTKNVISFPNNSWFQNESRNLFSCSKFSRPSFHPYLIRFTLVHFVFIPQGKENFKFRDILNWHGLLLLFISSIQVPHIQVWPSNGA